MPSEMLTLNDYIAVIRRRKWVILSALFICALLGFVYAAHKGTTHKATVQVSATDVQAPSSSGVRAGRQAPPTMPASWPTRRHSRDRRRCSMQR